MRRQQKGQAPDHKREQVKTDGQQMSDESHAEGAIGIKAKIKDQVLKQVTKHGKLLLYWKRQPTTGTSFPYVFPLWLSIALHCPLEQVCDCIAEMIDARELQTIGNIPKPITSAVLVEHVARWDAVSKNPAQEGKIQSKVTLLPPFAQTGKAVQYSQEQMESMLI